MIDDLGWSEVDRPFISTSVANNTHSALTISSTTRCWVVTRITVVNMNKTSDQQQRGGNIRLARFSFRDFPLSLPVTYSPFFRPPPLRSNQGLFTVRELAKPAVRLHKCTTRLCPEHERFLLGGRPLSPAPYRVLETKTSLSLPSQPWGVNKVVHKQRHFLAVVKFNVSDERNPRPSWLSESAFSNDEYTL